MIRIYFVRHGETDYNKNELLTGKTDVDINDLGKVQAGVVAEKLKNEKIEIIYCSPLKRARHTAEIINKNHKRQLNIENRLIERDYGEFTGKERKLIDREVSWNYFLDATSFPTIESVQSIFSRVHEFLDEIKESQKDKTVLIVAHSGVGRAIDCYFNGIPADGYLFDLGVKNASVNQYVIKP